MLVVTRGQFNTPLPLLLREGKQNTQNIKHEYTYIKKKMIRLLRYTKQRKHSLPP